jgi:dienelactone hydrolase
MRLPGRSFVGTCFVGFSLVVASSAHAADYGAAGPFKTVTKTIGGVVGLEGKIAYPDTDSGNYPVVILAHGFSSSPDNMIGWGEHLASHGFVAVAVKNCGSGFLCTPDPNAEVGLVKKTLQYVESGLAPAGVTDQADASRFLLLGHSAGGQAVTVAAAAFAPMGLVLFDPVGGGQSETDAEPAKSALAKICAPTLTVFAEPHKTAGGVFAPSCNKNGAWQGFANTSSGPRTSLVVDGSTHCDGELPARNTCGIPCGGAANATRQAVYRRYATAFALATLTNDDAAKATLTLAAINADSTVTAGTAEDGPACPGAGGQGGAGSGGGNAGEAGAGGTTSGEAGAGGGGAGEPGAGGSEAGAAGESSGEAGNGGEGGSAVGGSTGSAGKSGSGATGGNAQGGGGSKAGGAAGGTAGAAGSEPVPVNDVGLAVDDSGCGCRLASERSTNRAGLLVAGGIALFAARRRRR